MSSFNFFRYGWPYRTIKDFADPRIEPKLSIIPEGRVLKFAGRASSAYHGAYRINFIDPKTDEHFELYFADGDEEPDWPLYFVQLDYV